jgi:hypothetical protein
LAPDPGTSVTLRRNDDHAGVLREADGRIEWFDQAVFHDAGDGERIPRSASLPSLAAAPAAGVQAT